MLSDLKDSGSIEQDADMVLFINRPAKLGLSEMDESYAELIIEKNRAGEAAVIQLNFNGSLTKFTEESQSLAAYATQPIPSSANNPSPVDISPTPGYAPYDFDQVKDY
jgi:replicative DNA helicase